MNKKIHIRAYSAMNIKFTKKEKILTVVLLGVLVAYGWYQTAYGYTIGSNGTVTIHKPNGSWATFIGQPGANTNTTTTPDYKVLTVENSTWYMINSTGSLSKIHFGIENQTTGLTPYTRLLNGHLHHGYTSYPAVTLNLYFGLCKNSYTCDYMKNIESYSDHLVFLDGHHNTIHLVR